MNKIRYMIYNRYDMPLCYDNKILVFDNPWRAASFNTVYNNLEKDCYVGYDTGEYPTAKTINATYKVIVDEELVDDVNRPMLMIEDILNIRS